MYLYLLTLMVIFLLLFSYRFESGDIFSPIVVFLFSMFLGLVITLIYKQSWEFNMHFNTFKILSIGILAFVVFYCFINLVYKNDSCVEKSELRLLYVENYKIIVILCIQIVIMYIYLNEVSRVASRIGGYSSFSEMMNVYKQSTYDTSNLESEINLWVNQLSKISYAFAMVSAYCFINNILVGTAKRSYNILMILPYICYILQSFLTGGRALMLKSIIYILVIYYLLYNIKNGGKFKKNTKLILKFSLIVIFVLIIFWLVKESVGRVSDAGFFDYIAFYIAGGVSFFDKYMQNPYNNKPDVFGAETFCNIYAFLYKFGIGNDIVRHLEFRYSGTIHGNVYTAIRRYYSDFGMLGMIFLQGFNAVFYNLWYKRVKKIKFYHNNYYKNSFRVLLYGLCFYPIVYQIIDEQLISGIFITTTVISVIMVRIAFFIMVQMRIRITLNK